jgi:hypothetical protein
MNDDRKDKNDIHKNKAAWHNAAYDNPNYDGTHRTVLLCIKESDAVQRA